MSACRNAVPLLETFVDGELPADKVIEVEQHLVECGCCRERVRLTHALQVSTRRAVRSAVEPSPEFQARLLRALAAERESAERLERERDEQERGKPLSWRFIVPMAAAAGFTLVWAAQNTESQQQAQAVSEPARPPMEASMTTSVDRLIEQLVEHHASPPAPEVTEPSLITNLEPEVGVPVHMPSLNQYGARWEGASVVPVKVPTPSRSLRAASLRYRLAGHRVTLYVYDSSRFPLRATLEPRVVRNMPVYVGSRRGYSIAAVEKRGLGWAVATDLGDRESAELVAASAH